MCLDTCINHKIIFEPFIFREGLSSSLVFEYLKAISLYILENLYKHIFGFS